MERLAPLHFFVLTDLVTGAIWWESKAISITAALQGDLMAFLLPILEGAGAGLLGNTLGGIFGGGAAGSAENGAMSALNGQDENFQLGMYASEIQNQEQLQIQSEVFDQMMDERSENMREVDTLRNVDMAQRKADDSITKKFIQSITE